MSCKCQGCEKQYKVDIIVPNEIWERIKPKGKAKGQGMLCGPCIMSRIENFGEYGAFHVIGDPEARCQEGYGCVGLDDEKQCETCAAKFSNYKERKYNPKMSEHTYVRVGVGVMILNDQDEVLLGKRRGSHGAGEWSLPGGHLEKWESFEECCIREVKEETDLDIKDIEKSGFSNDMFPCDGDKHYVTLFFRTWSFTGKLKRMEPDKCDAWEWFPLDDLPEPMFQPTRKALEEI